MTIPNPTDGFLLLAATLIKQLPSFSSATLDDAVLLQLQAIFGPMLMSALQLVDRREVVKIDLPTGRIIWQVTSSTGLPYTIHLALPDSVPKVDSTTTTDETALQADEPMPIEPDRPPHTNSIPTDTDHISGIYDLVDSFRGLYCPCTGFAYNSISGDRNYFCKHLLAVVLAHQMDRAVPSTVGMPQVVGLLGLNRDEYKADEVDGVKGEVLA